MRKALLLAALSMTVLSAGMVNAAEFEIQMLNKGEKGGMVFKPDFVRAA